MTTKQDFVITRGKTFAQILRWEAPPLIYKPITGVAQSAPVLITCAGHGIPNGWRVKVESVKGMTQLNSDAWQRVTVVDADTIELNEINSLDFKPYASGGVLKMNTPVNMAGFTARMTIKDKVGGTVLLSTEAAHAPLNLLHADVDNTAKTITLSIDADETAEITWKKGVYDLELVSGAATPVVTGLLYGSITVSSEVTT